MNMLLISQYTDIQLTVMLIASVVIGFFLGAMAVGVFKTGKQKKAE